MKMSFLKLRPRVVASSAALTAAFWLAGLCGGSCQAQFVSGGSPILGGSTVMGAAVATPSSSAVCPKCGKIHSNAPSPAMSSPGRPAVAPGSADSVPVGRRGGGVSNVLSALNAQRSRQGLSGLGYDPALQAVAERRAQRMASTGNKNHPPGSFSPGTHEGVGWSSSYSPSGVSACFTSDPNMRAAGAAMATGRDGVYFCVVYR